MESDKTTYESYVYRHYRHLMTSDERLADRHLIGTLKATLGRSDVDAQAEVKGSSSAYRKLLSEDPWFCFSHAMGIQHLFRTQDKEFWTTIEITLC
jgi:hypothetical protein